MRYLGGKKRLAKLIKETIMNEVGIGNGHYYEPFIGGGSVGAVMGNSFDYAYYSDIHPDLIAMWNALKDGWQPPTEASKEYYDTLKKDTTVSPERGFIGFGGSFGGKFFNGYARGFQANGSPRNYPAESARAVAKDIQGMKAKKETLFTCQSYDEINPTPSSIVYCDPPYENTTGYSSTPKFNHEKFWAQAKNWAEKGSHVFVSSYQAPEEWEVLWEKEHRSSVRRGGENRHMTKEKLFTIKT